MYILWVLVTFRRRARGEHAGKARHGEGGAQVVFPGGLTATLFLVHDGTKRQRLRDVTLRAVRRGKSGVGSVVQ